MSIRSTCRIAQAWYLHVTLLGHTASVLLWHACESRCSIQQGSPAAGAPYSPSRQMGFRLTTDRLTLCPKRSRMLSMPYKIIVGRSSDSPHAITLTSSGSPIGRSISGRNMPLLPTSIHFFSCSLYENISMLGSVYGLYAGLKRSLGRPRRLKNWLSTPMRCPRVSPRSQMRPSTWWNSARCVASMRSLLQSGWARRSGGAWRAGG
eukprot:363865-Chlamydomonas_euryale.AAC.13